jgi:serine/threonine-protein kinase
MRIRKALFAASLALAGASLTAEAAPPPIVPPGWTADRVPGDRMIIRYVSPDGRAVLTLRDMPRDRELSALLRGPDESVTYRQRGRSWTVVSGYRGDQIYYRRANLACGGARWHLIDLNYPASEKRRMDATVTYISRHLGSYRDVCPNR